MMEIESIFALGRKILFSTLILTWVPLNGSCQTEDRTLNLGFYPASSLFIGPSLVPSMTPLERRPSGSLAMGDLNGDGRMELAIGESGAEVKSKGGATQGLVTLVVVGETLPPTWVVDPHVKQENLGCAYFYDTAGTVDNIGLALGHALAIGDVNGDGRKDLVVAVPSIDPNKEQGIPRVHILFGRQEYPTFNNLNLGPYPSPAGSDVVIYGPSDEGFAGSIACGDMDGDAKAEVLIGAPLRGEDRSGAVYILKGRSAWPRVIDLRMGKPDGMIGLQTARALSGWAIAVGDLDGNGRCEAVVGSPGVSSGQNAGVGAVFIVSLSKGSGGSEGSLQLESHTPLLGDIANRFLGSSVACGKGPNGGFIAVGACGPQEAGVESGLFVANVQPDLSLPATLSDLGSAGGIGLIHAPGALGSVLCIGDMDGDGCDDVVAGMPKEPGPGYDPWVMRPECGRVLILSPSKMAGKWVDLRKEMPTGLFVDIFGSDPQSHFGASMAVGDLNGDGQLDLVGKTTGLAMEPDKIRPGTLVLCSPGPRAGYVPPIPPDIPESAVLLVTYQPSADSIAISRRYKEIHPGVHEVTLTEEIPLTRDGEGLLGAVTPEAYRDKIAVPICRAMDEQKLWESVRYIVTTQGLPLKVTFLSSVDAQLCLLPQDWQKGRFRARDLSAAVPNPYAYAHIPFILAPNSPRPPLFLVTRIAGLSAEEAIRALETSQRPVGAFEATLIVDNDAVTCKRMGLDPRLPQGIADRLVGIGAKVLYDDTPDWVTQCDGPVTGYFSWGTNSSDLDGKGGDYVARALEFTYAPGAAFLTLESYNGWTFIRDDRSRSPFKQGLLADFIGKGGSCGVGNVSEPTLQKSARPDIFFMRLALGYGLADAAYASMTCVGWRQVVVGDPLLQWPTQRILYSHKR